MNSFHIPEDTWVAYDKKSKSCAKSYSSKFAIELWAEFHGSEQILSECYWKAGKGWKIISDNPDLNHLLIPDNSVLAFRIPPIARPLFRKISEGSVR